MNEKRIRRSSPASLDRANGCKVDIGSLLMNVVILQTYTITGGVARL